MGTKIIPYGTSSPYIIILFIELIYCPDIIFMDFIPKTVNNKVDMKFLKEKYKRKNKISFSMLLFLFHILSLKKKQNVFYSSL